jgi:hypothetical protein
MWKEYKRHCSELAGAVTSQLCEVEVFKYYVEGSSQYTMDPYNNGCSSRKGGERAKFRLDLLSCCREIRELSI